MIFHTNRPRTPYIVEQNCPTHRLEDILNEFASHGYVVRAIQCHVSPSGETWRDVWTIVGERKELG